MTPDRRDFLWEMEPPRYEAPPAPSVGLWLWIIASWAIAAFLLAFFFLR